MKNLKKNMDSYGVLIKRVRNLHIAHMVYLFCVYVVGNKRVQSCLGVILKKLLESILLNVRKTAMI